MDTSFHCTLKLKKVIARNKHRLPAPCDDVCKVLKNNPNYGVVCDRHSKLRKMRVHVPGLNIGKRGGYRLIYRLRPMDEIMHVVLLTAYFKADMEDLSESAYSEIEDLAELILSNPINYDWIDM